MNICRQCTPIRLHTPYKEFQGCHPCPATYHTLQIHRCRCLVTQHNKQDIEDKFQTFQEETP